MGIEFKTVLLVLERWLRNCYREREREKWFRHRKNDVAFYGESTERNSKRKKFIFDRENRERKIN